MRKSVLRLKSAFLYYCDTGDELERRVPKSVVHQLTDWFAHTQCEHVGTHSGILAPAFVPEEPPAMNPRILVTGSEGLIGRILCEGLAANYEVFALDVKASDKPRHHTVDILTSETSSVP